MSFDIGMVVIQMPNLLMKDNLIQEQKVASLRSSYNLVWNNFQRYEVREVYMDGRSAFH